MQNMNTLTIVGNLTADPILRHTSNQVPVANFAVASNRRYELNGETVEEVVFVDCTAWRDLGDHVASTLHKGDRVVATGRMEQTAWTTADGQERSKLRLVVSDVGASLRFATADIHRISRESAAPAPVDTSPELEAVTI
jgi:single-strand DNA-binding protein